MGIITGILLFISITTHANPTLAQLFDTVESQFLLLAQQRAIRDLTTEKQRQPKQLYLFATYPLGSGQEQSADHVEKLLVWVVAQYDTFKGLKEQNQQKYYVQLLTQGFTDGYLHWEQQLNARMGLQVTPMGTEDLWHYLWTQFNSTTVPPVPQCLELSDDDGDAKLSELIHDPLHATSHPHQPPALVVEEPSLPEPEAVVDTPGMRSLSSRCRVCLTWNRFGQVTPLDGGHVVA
ncbi:hypothetical protein PGN35_000275 [Nodosilinea sp. PGN35]